MKSIEVSQYNSVMNKAAELSVKTLELQPIPLLNTRTSLPIDS
jgi:hypothetical protein